MKGRDEQLLAAIAKLLDEHVPLEARPVSDDIGWLGVVRNQQQRTLTLGAPNDSPAEREALLLKLFQAERELIEKFSETIASDEGRAWLAAELERRTGESHAEAIEVLAQLQAILDKLGPHESQLLTPEQVFRSLHVIAILRGDVESVDERVRRMTYLSKFGITASVSLRGREFLARVGRLYVAGFYPEAVIIGAAAIEEELEQLLADGRDGRDGVTLGTLISRASQRRLISAGAEEAARRLQARRDHLLHLVMDAGLPEQEMRACLRDIGHVLSEICR